MTNIHFRRTIMWKYHRMKLIWLRPELHWLLHIMSDLNFLKLFLYRRALGSRLEWIYVVYNSLKFKLPYLWLRHKRRFAVVVHADVAIAVDVADVVGILLLYRNDCVQQFAAIVILKITTSGVVCLYLFMYFLFEFPSLLLYLGLLAIILHPILVVIVLFTLKLRSMPHHLLAYIFLLSYWDYHRKRMGVEHFHFGFYLYYKSLHFALV